jgi:hypothetical protein
VTTVALVSASGAPGCTTLALLLGRVLDGVTVVELSLAGGTAAGVLGLRWSPGVSELSAGAHRGLGSDALRGCTQRSVGGIDVVVGPAGGTEARAAASRLAPALLAPAQLGPALLAGRAEGGSDLLLDCGRVYPSSPLWPVAVGADLTVLLVRQVTGGAGETATRVSHARDLAVNLGAGGAALGLVVVGEAPYRPSEVAAAVGVPLLGPLPESVAVDAVLQDASADRSGSAGVGGRRLRRSVTPLWQALDSLAGTVEATVTGAAPGPADPTSRSEQVTA